MQENLDLVVEAVWEFTRPKDMALAFAYKRALTAVLQRDPLGRYRASFARPKKSGGQRIIRPAKKLERVVEQFLTQWMLHTCKVGNDYAYINHRGVKAAVAVHQKAKYALVIDLKDAFSFVTGEKIIARLQIHHPDMPEIVGQTIGDLITFYNVLPQGCVSSPYYYNLCILPLEELVNPICATYNLQYSQYADNFCLSSESPFDFEKIKKLIIEAIRNCGFEISWIKEFVNRIEYIGFVIENGKYDLNPDTLKKFVSFLQRAIQTPNPAASYSKALGIYIWVRQVYDCDFPENLYNLFFTYFKKAHQMPDSFEKMVNDRLHVGRLC